METRHVLLPWPLVLLTILGLATPLAAQCIVIPPDPPAQPRPGRVMRGEPTATV